MVISFKEYYISKGGETILSFANFKQLPFTFKLGMVLAYLEETYSIGVFVNENRYVVYFYGNAKDCLLPYKPYKSNMMTLCEYEYEDNTPIISMYKDAVENIFDRLQNPF